MDTRQQKKIQIIASLIAGGATASSYFLFRGKRRHYEYDEGAVAGILSIVSGLTFGTLICNWYGA